MFQGDIRASATRQRKYSPTIGTLVVLDQSMPKNKISSENFYDTRDLRIDNPTSFIDLGSTLLPLLVLL